MEEKFDDEQLLSTALVIELEDVKKTLAQLKLEKPKPTHSGPFTLNVDYYTKKFFEELDSIDSRLEKSQSGEQLRIWKSIRLPVHSKTIQLFLTTPNYSAKRKTRMILIQTQHAIFVVQSFSVSLMATVSSSAPSLMDVVQHLANQCLSLYL